MSTPLEAHCVQIRELLASLGLEAREVAGSAGEEEELEQHVWMVGAGSATVLVRLIWDVKEEEGWFRVSSPLVHLPERNLLPFYRRLLELNSELPGVSLSAVHDVIELSGERPLEGMDGAEARSLLTRVAACADKLDDSLHETFGAPLWEPQ